MTTEKKTQCTPSAPLGLISAESGCVQSTTTTLCITSLGNIEGLRTTLMSVLGGHTLPAEICLRLEGPRIHFSDFYLEQLVNLARLRSVGVRIVTATSKGVRHARQSFLDEARTPLLWFLDDDVCPHFHCLNYLLRGLQKAAGDGWRVAYIQGTKADVSNTRGYGNFDLKWHRAYDDDDQATLNREGAYNFLWELSNSDGLVPVLKPTRLMDTGNVLLHVDVIKTAKVSFVTSETHTNSGGEDTMFGLMLAQANTNNFWTPDAFAFHLEKPSGGRFGEHAYRKELIMRAADVAGLSPELKNLIAREVLAWEQVHHFAEQPNNQPRSVEERTK